MDVQHQWFPMFQSVLFHKINNIFIDTKKQHSDTMASSAKGKKKKENVNIVIL